MSDTSITVLLVEDNAEDARLVREMLSEPADTAVRLEHVDRLSAGLDRLAAGGVDVLLLNLSLPDAYGLDVCIKAHAAAKHVPIVVLTGLDDETTAARTLRVGARDYLGKGQIDSTVT